MAYILAFIPDCRQEFSFARQFCYNYKAARLYKKLENKTTSSDIETRLRGTRIGHIVQEFLTNTAHFPIANIFFEMLLLDHPLKYFREADLYVLVTATILQAYFIGSWHYNNKSRPLLGNLISPFAYTIAESAMDGLADFISSPAHIAYWGFSLAIGLLQELRLRMSGKPAKALILIENVIRTSILLVMYGIFEAQTSAEVPYTITRFLSDPSHIFIVVVLMLFGLMLGFANLTAQSYLTILRQTATQLRLYSEWLLGRDLLSGAVIDPDSLTMQRQERTLLFMDIRGFTQWSEAQTPEEVVHMLNAYFDTAERIWSNSSAIKTKHTADEIMIVFQEEQAATVAAIELRTEVGNFLHNYELSVGIGLHSGPLVEGLLGSQDVKGYDVIGDTVNTAKRLCEAAAGGEILISEHVYSALGSTAAASESRQIVVKGKAEPLVVYSLKAITQASYL